jgi:8-oxo-dGTP diphosphatase
MSSLFQVVVCAVIESNKKYLIARRHPQQRLAGFWEFPGGKLEANETPEQGVRREILEELNIDVEVERLLHAEAHTYSHATVLALFYQCRPHSTNLTLTAHDDVVWCTADTLNQFQLLPANQRIVNLLQKNSNSEPNS